MVPDGTCRKLDTLQLLCGSQPQRSDSTCNCKRSGTPASGCMHDEDLCMELLQADTFMGHGTQWRRGRLVAEPWHADRAWRREQQQCFALACMQRRPACDGQHVGHVRVGFAPALCELVRREHLRCTSLPSSRSCRCSVDACPGDCSPSIMAWSVISAASGWQQAL